ncbi:mitochondrial import inner membrane translocase subunit Tim13-like [Dermatophagoides pteronyssinus]|uniref:Mitochondrial import inner membrane translocase subunit Tim13 n=2 Tax=Dermatophagoides pteronyssinus TaxID=6956 RepID=A0ABQ8ISH7_DERPT|nr:mitochondrial import inner membrane translocase subunit Tim13-like [Dermatophagoides pteronyssinus]KAH9413279.1 Mitochondrial import inner membrane translocase subunit Tim13 [Dermatophagoides pteronyssinus]
MDSNNLTSTQKAELIDNVKEQIAVATIQELLSKITNKCFEKCISKPGTTLDSSETKCLNHCVDRFFDSYNIVSMAYGSRVQNESHQFS